MFGKNPQGLGGMPTFGAQQFVSAGKRAQYDRKEYHWKGAYKLPVSPGPPDIGRLIPGSYLQQWLDDDGNLQEGELPFVMYKEHHNGRASCVCSAGPYCAVKDKALPCPSCGVFWQDHAIRKMKKANGDRTPGPERISLRDYFAFNWWDYGLYYQVPQLQRNGQPRLSQKTGQPYTEWVKGQPNDPRYHGYPFKWGHLMPWSVSSGYKDTLDTYTKIVANGCASCGGRDTIVTITRNCGNPQCKAVIYDSNTTLSPEQRAIIDYSRFQCPACGQRNFTTEQIQCKTCQNPKRASIFDVDLQVMRSSSQKGTAALHIVNYSEPRPLQVPPEVAAQIQPLDLLKKFAPTAPDDQNRIMGLGALQQNMAQPGYLGVQAYGQPMSGMPPQAPVAAPPGMAWQPPQGMPPQQPYAPVPYQQPPMAPPAMAPPGFAPAPMQMQQPQWPQQAPMQMQAPAFPAMAQPMLQPPAVPYEEDDQQEESESNE